MLPEYLGGIPYIIPTPYDYILTFTRSVGLAIEIAIVPVNIPAAIFWRRVGFYPSFKGPVIKSLTGLYKPILNPANKTCL